jgi:hypothetical protein
MSPTTGKERRQTERYMKTAAIYHSITLVACSRIESGNLAIQRTGSF